MIWLLAGAAVLVLLLLSLNAFARASVTTVRWLVASLAAVGGILLAVLLFLGGQGPRILLSLVMFGPMLWRRWQQSRAGGYRPPGGTPGGTTGGTTSGTAGGPGAPPRRQGSGMTRAEALEVLGLKSGATEEEILAAHRRLMRMAHPDTGGSDWLASRINQARDVLMG